MALYKSRTKSTELLILELLDRRRGLSKKERRYYFNQEKGFEGEVKFDRLTEQLNCECLILNDLLLNLNHTMFQIDSLIVSPGKIYFYEIKNHDGDYFYEADRLFKKPKLEVNNPLHQLDRSESLLRQLLLRHGFNFHIDASIVFINSQFTLYQAPLNKPIIYPTQVNQHMENLNLISAKLSKQDVKVADFLLSLHNPTSPYERLPSYTCDQLQKGIICPNCFSNALFVEKNKCICHKCNYLESVTDAVCRNIQEFKFLFPQAKVTTNTIYDWCEIVKSKRTIRRILKSNFNAIGVGQWTYYE